jgi:hypothetical protein
MAIQKPPGNKALSDPATRSGKDEKARALTPPLPLFMG